MVTRQILYQIFFINISHLYDINFRLFNTLFPYLYRYIIIIIIDGKSTESEPRGGCIVASTLLRHKTCCGHPGTKLGCHQFCLNRIDVPKQQSLLKKRNIEPCGEWTMSPCTLWADENISFGYAKISELDISMRPYPTMNVGQDQFLWRSSSPASENKIKI